MASSQSPPIHFVALIEEDTEIVAWINNALDGADEKLISQSGLTSLDEKITQLLASLDIACEETSQHLERIIEDVSRSVPRVAYDLHFMKDNAISLQTSVAKVLQQTKEAVPDTTNEALCQLRHLDMVKGRMEAARKALKEAESWGALDSEVTSLLAERNYAKAAGRLSEASRNMVVFQNTPEYESRRTLMVNLQNQLEASLSSALVAAINVQDTTSCQTYFSIFSQIQRESEFRNYYNASRRESIVDLWRNSALSDCDAPSFSLKESAQTFGDFLPKFYCSLLSLLRKEVTIIPTIFPDPAATLSAFISSTLSQLQPSLPQRLSSLSGYHGETALKNLIVALKTTEEFAEDVEKLFEELSQPSPDDPNTQIAQHSKAKPVSRRRSTRMSISWRGGGMPPPSVKHLFPQVMEWKQELFQPFLDFQIDYGTLESNLLEHTLRRMMDDHVVERSGDPNHARLLKDKVVAVITVAEESLARCEAFTHGYGFLGLVHALDNLFKSFLAIWTDNVRLDAHTVGTRYQGVTSGEDFSDMDYSVQDWTDFQRLLHLLSSARTVFERISAFETKLRESLTQITVRIGLQKSGLEAMSSDRGAIQVLEQSPLNSAELHLLLGIVDVEQQSSSLAPLRHSQLLLTHESSEPLLTEARRAVFAFASSCQLSLQTTLLSPLRKHLVSYRSSPAWDGPEDSKTRQRGNDLQIPTFSLSPSESMQRVAEGLLNLPRLFEVYAEDDALAFSLHTLPNIDSNLLKPLVNHKIPESLHSSPTRRSSVSFLSKPTTVDPEIVSTAWLSSLGHSLLIHFTQDVLPSIPSLSSSGMAQLTSDLEYLENIIQAINVDFPELRWWKDLLNYSDDEGKKSFSESDGADRPLQVVSGWRGWNR